jgi:hypothetical protein
MRPARGCSEPPSTEPPPGILARVSGRIPALRAGALLAAGALAVHELRYLAGYGSDAAHVLGAHGHAYLIPLLPLVTLLLAMALARFLLALVDPWRGAATKAGAAGESRAPRLSALWLWSTVCLWTAYACQELLEGALAPGHPAGIAGVVGQGGWVAFAAALAVGLLVALLLRGADAAIAARASRGRRWAPRGAAQPSQAAPRVVHLLRPAPLAGGVAGRAPPTTS